MNNIRAIILIAGVSMALVSCQPEIEIVSVESIALNTDQVTLFEGQTMSLFATITPGSASNQNVQWSSDNLSVATVDSGGHVTAVGQGTAVITVKTADGSKTDRCMIEVKSNVIDVTVVDIDKSEIILKPGDVFPLSVIVKPDNATDKNVTWFSSDTSVAMVENDGKVTAIRTGSAIITAKSGDKEDTCTVIVSPIDVLSVVLNKDRAELKVGESLALSAVVLPEDATDKTVTWTSSDSTVITVDNEGMVNAHKMGSAVITAKAGNVSAVCAVDVIPTEVISIDLDKTSVELKIGESFVLSAVVKPDDATDKTVTWSSSNPSVALVDSAGKVMALKPGMATITARAGIMLSKCNVNVIQPVSGIQLYESKIMLDLNETRLLSATVLPVNATNNKVNWTSESSSVVSVNSNGEITALNPGTSVVTAKTEDGGFTASCEVTVRGIVMEESRISIISGDFKQLSYTCFPSDLAIRWSSSNDQVATMKLLADMWVVEANKKGSAQIMAYTEDNRCLCTCEVEVRDVTDMVDIYCYSMDISSGSYSAITGSFTAGAKISWGIVNKTDKSINIVSLSLIDGKTGGEVNYQLPGVYVVKSNQAIILTTTIIATMYMPRVRVTYDTYWGTYTEEYQFNGSIGGF